MAEQAAKSAGGKSAQGLAQRIRSRSPAASQVVGFFALVATLGSAAAVAGMAAIGIGITLLLLTPVFLFFSPILVPAGIILLLCLAGVLVTTGTGVTAVSVASWIYNYVRGRRPSGSEPVEYARRKAIEMADLAKPKAQDVVTQARELGGQAQEQAAKVAPTPAAP